MQQLPVSDKAGDSFLVELASAVRGSFSTVEDMTKAFIRDAIQRGAFRPGQRLPQDSIADLLGVSRMPVRASLRQLESEGLVTFHAHRGASVTALTPEQIAEIYELRVLLETFALEHAMARLAPEQLEQLRVLSEGMDRAKDDYDWRERRQNFYLSLYAAAGRPQAVEMIRRLRSYVGPYLLLQRVIVEPHAHHAMLQFIEDGDVAAAKTWLTAHLNEVSVELQRLIEEENLQPPA